MKIRFRRDKFIPIFTLISSFTAARDIRPALQNVKIVVNDQKVLLLATDGEIGGRCELALEDCDFVVENSGEAILPAKLLRKIMAETNDDEISLDLDGTKLRVVGSNFKYQLTTWLSDDFPTVKAFEENVYHRISTASLCDMIKRTSFAIDAENSHYSLGGVLFNFYKDRMNAVSTDGRRLAFQERAAQAVDERNEDEKKDDDRSVNENKTIFPPKTLNLLERAAADADEALFSLSEGQAIVNVGRITISTTLIEGRFPNWRSILPEKSGRKHVDLIAGQLASAVRQADIVATEEKPGVFLNFEKGKVSIAASGAEVGDSNIEFPVSYDGEDASLRLDSRFLSEFLRVISPEESVSFYFLPDKPALFETGDSYSYVVMPLT